MEVLILLLFVSATLVAGAVLFFVRGVGSGDFEHGDHLALLPLENEGGETTGEREAIAPGPSLPSTHPEEETDGS